MPYETWADLDAGRMAPVAMPAAGAQRLATFVGGETGIWRVVRMEAVAGPALEPVPRLTVVEGRPAPPDSGRWWLRGVTSHERYVARPERERLVALQASLGRPEATWAALLPIRKSAAWWELTQDERRAIFEERSGHIRTGLDYLPAVARQLYHGRDLGEPFDFLTWFEFAPAHASAFDELVRRLRESEEWRYVEHEVDIRLVRDV